MQNGAAREGMRALIAGGNFGGLSAAIGLRKLGMDVTVFERMGSIDSFRQGWPGLHLWTNAMRAMAELGVAEKLKPFGDKVELFEYRSWNGGLLTKWPLGDLGRKLGQPTILIRRADLHKVLADELGEERIVLGKQATGFTQDDEGVTLRFADGSEERGDVLIAADGINSALRAQIHGPEPKRYAGHSLWRGRTSYRHGLIEPEVMWSLWGPGGRMLINQMAPDRLSWFCVLNAPEGGKEVDKDFLVRRLEGWSPPAQTVIRETDPEVMQRFDVYDRVPLKKWGEGRVTLLGDAAHPMLNTFAQGACQAVEDAAALMKAFQEESDTVAALQNYEKRRIGYTAAMVNRSRMMANVGGWQNPVAWRFRDRMIKTVGGVMWKGFQGDMSHQF